MQNLLIEQRGPLGLIKTWKLRSEQKSATFGHSKHADLRTSMESAKGLQGVFEFKNNKWYYLNLDLSTKHPEMGEDQSELCLDQQADLRWGTTTLHIRPLEVRSALFSTLLQGDVHQPGTGRTPFQLFTVYSGETLLETQLVSIEKKFTSKFDTSKTKFVPEKLQDFKRTMIGHLEISQRTLYLTDVEALKHTSPGQFVDADAKKTMTVTFVGGALLALLFILSPRQNSLDDVLAQIPQTAHEVKMEVPKKKKVAAQSAPKEESKPQEKQQAAASPKNTGGSSKAASMIKNLASGRISSLIGKVSAAAARSANVVVTSGIPAGSAATGRALAALGAIDKSGKDWSSEGNGTGITISTNGKAGGKGIGGMGKLANGKAGTGGVGLLEEEGEIVGGLDREIIAQYIRAHLGEILYCYERQLSASPDLYGKVGIKFTIAGTGTVEAQRIGDTTLKNSTVEGCILQRVARWKFPTPEGGTKVLVTYPFLFKSTN